MKPEVERYIESVPPDSRPLFDRLHALVLSLYPQADVVISYQIPTYKTKTGWVGLGTWKSGVSIYTNNPGYIAKFKEKHPKIKTNKASINLKLTDEAPDEDLAQVIRSAVEGEKMES